MHSILTLEHWHPVISGMVMMAIFNCAVTALPTPAPSGSKFYEWFFSFTHLLVGALSRIAAQYRANGNGHTDANGKA